jgi:hypothetical protein
LSEWKMERRVLTNDDRSLLRALLNERIARGPNEQDHWNPDECKRVLKKIDGYGKTLVVESEFRDEPDEAERRALESGCG